MSIALYSGKYSGVEKLNIQQGNSKLGRRIHTVNTLAGDRPIIKKDGTILTDITGTCGGLCEGCIDKCYAMNYTKRHHNTVIPSYIPNTLLAKHNVKSMFEQLEEYIDRKKVKILRYHSSGEIPSYSYLIAMIELANKKPEVQFYCYTKQFEYLEKAFLEVGIPQNLHINVSIWHGNYDNKYGFQEFIYDDGSDPEIANLYHCPSVDKNGNKTGVKCQDCGMCFNSSFGNKIAVYSH